ncbi:hypothetical protein E2C01_077439 [Portunus trituberculatus]|uniref:Uncharacterized protein n=1 Tax=Portunus trituberculatus TaxID=210409 RepID=A0A5B7IM46_PORTR|nr:hypothetical protein [Portunus trituberculatus]
MQRRGSGGPLRWSGRTRRGSDWRGSVIHSDVDRGSVAVCIFATTAWKLVGLASHKGAVEVEVGMQVLEEVGGSVCCVMNGIKSVMQQTMVTGNRITRSGINRFFRSEFNH